MKVQSSWKVREGFLASGIVYWNAGFCIMSLTISLLRYHFHEIVYNCHWIHDWWGITLALSFIVLVFHAIIQQRRVPEMQPHLAQLPKHTLPHQQKYARSSCIMNTSIFLTHSGVHNGIHDKEVRILEFCHQILHHYSPSHLGLAGTYHIWNLTTPSTELRTIM